jgi:hypothetical protein
VVDSLHDVSRNPYVTNQGPRQTDGTAVEKWLGVRAVKPEKRASKVTSNQQKKKRRNKK